MPSDSSRRLHRSLNTFDRNGLCFLRRHTVKKGRKDFKFGLRLQARRGLLNSGIGPTLVRSRPSVASRRDHHEYVDKTRCYLYRAVDKHGQTIAFLLTEQGDKEVALKLLKKAIRRNGLPEIMIIADSEANAAAIKRYNEEHGSSMVIRQGKYVNYIVEQAQRSV